MQIELISDEASFQRLEHEWNDLISDSEVDHPFLQWNWCHTWWRHYGADRSLALILLRDSGRLVGLAPLFVESGRRGRPGTVALLGSGEVCSEYLGFVLRRGWEETGTQRITDYLLQGSGLGWKQLHLSHVASNGAIAPALQSLLHASGRLYRIEARKQSWQVHLTHPWEELLRQFPRSRRERYRQAKRDLAKHGLEFREISSAAEIDEAWSELVRLHEARWALDGHRGCFESPRFAAFHRDMLPLLWDRGMLTLNTLRQGSQAIAASYCLRHNGVVYFYQAGFDPQWMHARPGHVLRYCEIKRASERGDRIFDFLSGDEPYKSLWGTHSTPMWNVYIAGQGMLPHLQLTWQNSVAWLKQSARTYLSGSAWSRLQRWKNRWTNRPEPTAA